MKAVRGEKIDYDAGRIGKEGLGHWEAAVDSQYAKLGCSMAWGARNPQSKAFWIYVSCKYACEGDE